MISSKEQYLKFMFLRWMAANMSYPYARSLTYAEFLTKFVWKDDALNGFLESKASQLEGNIVIPSSDQTFDKLVHFSYPNILDNIFSKDFFKARTILAPTLGIVEDVNNHLMDDYHS
ncbi:hypothetical protein Ahy_Scaffold1g107216 [Arachis hypogaea]|uniref:Uncharacterized protein n=1 Tax=Arachis hypogaea TaxID=3818 RepID=A0A444WUX4_ARAHY|nr:hypothetical protein Ahy_Scaffold1g107216 [Arachis hypogaea]